MTDLEIKIKNIIKDTVSDPQKLQELKSAVLGFWPNRKTNYFPGPLPVSIERKNFATLKKYPYVISLKSDGVRFFLMLNNNISYIVDRQFNFYIVSVKFHDTIYGANNDGCGLILDGEMIIKNDKLCYNVHDCVCIFSRDHSQEQLPTRYEAINTAINLCDSSQSDFEIKKKEFYNYSDFNEKLLSDSDHKIDGIILTPVNKEIGTEKQPTLFKWKFHHTVDFQIIEENDEYFSYVIYNQRLIKYASVKKSNEVFRKQLLQNCPDFKSGSIVECLVNLKDERFDPIILRNDKCHPNSKKTVDNTIKNAKEDITLDEILQLLRE